MKKSIYLDSLADLGIIKRIPCTDVESSEYRKTKQVPEDVYNYGDDSFYFVRYTEIPKEEAAIVAAVITAKNVKTIKNCAIFFTVLAVISLILSVVSALL